MLKGKLVFLSLIATALLCWQVLPVGVQSANSGIVDPCSSFASSPGGCWVVCPLGDGAPLNALAPATGDATISVTVKDNTGAPVPGIPAADFWLIGATGTTPGDQTPPASNPVVLCGGAGSINATAASDANGQTTITGIGSLGGCENGIAVVVQGTVILSQVDCITPLNLPITVRSPDITGDLQVEAVDFTFFGNHWPGIGNPPDTCIDYDCDTDVDAVDFTIFGNHYDHACN